MSAEKTNKTQDGLELQKLLAQKVCDIERLYKKLQLCANLEQKITFLSSLSRVQVFLKMYPLLGQYLKEVPKKIVYVLSCFIALEQVEPSGLAEVKNFSNNKEMESLIEMLLSTEIFYESIGGVVGYHLKVLTLMLADLRKEAVRKKSTYLPPPFIDIREHTQEVSKHIIIGLKELSKTAEIYAVGGASDRLHLEDEETKKSLPAARLIFAGQTLLASLIRDVEAREYLAYKLFGKQYWIPIVLMTSHEKNNDAEIESICREANWFGRPRNFFLKVAQPLVPVITIQGNWAISGPLQFILKPGGHGVIWKLAHDAGIFDWLEEQGKLYLLIRQVNNPVAGLDYGLLAHMGYGIAQNKAFGFASCPRLSGLSEGINVLERRSLMKAVYCSITNLEYTELAKKKIFDHFKKNKDDLEVIDFPANTNILFANTAKIKKIIPKHPIPGMLVNMKLGVHVWQKNNLVTVPGARLESTMQNIADSIVTILHNDRKINREELESYITLNDRSKTLSVAKKAYEIGKSIKETPEGCFYDLLVANRALMKDYLQMQVPEMNSHEEYLEKGPSVLFLYHPALGPLYSIIAQKILKGVFASNSEMQLEISECYMSNIEVNGSLLIEAQNVVGHIDEKGHKIFSDSVGRVVLENVRVINRGIDRTIYQKYWKNQIKRHESLHIILEYDAEFYATDILFEGNIEIRVPRHTKAVAKMNYEGKIEISYEPKSVKPAWHWTYKLTRENTIKLTRT